MIKTNISIDVIKQKVLDKIKSLKPTDGTTNMEIWGPNNGPVVNEILKYSGIEVGNPWCAALGYYAISKVLEELKIKNPLIKSGYCPTIEDWARLHGILSDTPDFMDIVLVCDSVSAFHYAFALTQHSKSNIGTIEGNTNIDGSSNGDGIYERTRKLIDKEHGTYLKFVKWYKLIDIAGEKTFKVYVDNEEVCEAKLTNGKAYIPVRVFVNALKKNVSWDENYLTVNGVKILKNLTYIDNTAYCYIRDIVSICKADIVLVNYKEIYVAS